MPNPATTPSRRPPATILLDNCVLERFTSLHADGVAEAVAASAEDLSLWMPWVETAQRSEVQHARAAAVERLWDQGLEFAYVVVTGGGSDRRVSGTISLYWRRGDRCEMGYWIRSADTRRGLGAAVLTAAGDTACALPGVTSTDLYVDRNNTASRRLAESCGYSVRGELRRDPRTPGESGTYLHFIRSCGAPSPGEQGRPTTQESDI